MEVGEVPVDVDATPYFARAFERARLSRASRIVISAGVYRFKTLDATKLSHIVLDQLSDVLIEGNNATLIFENNKHGIYITRCRRLKIQNLVLRYSFATMSLALAESDATGEINLKLVGGRYEQSNSGDAPYVTQYDPLAGHWVKNGKRVIHPEKVTSFVGEDGSKVVRSASFKLFSAGEYYTVYHHFYGGNAVQIQDSYKSGKLQAEDITLEAIHIRSSPGMGIVVYGLKRGLLVSKSSIAPDSSQSIGSAEYDGIRILVAGGDILIRDNVIRRQGDDALNLDSPIHPVVDVIGPSTLTLSTYSRFIKEGDRVFFFDADGQYLSSAVVSTSPISTGGKNNQNHRITFDVPIVGIEKAAFARTLELSEGRVAVVGNTIGPCYCAGVLVQKPYVLIADNLISDTTTSAIRLLTNFGNFKEGVGAFAATVTRNHIINSGVNRPVDGGWGAISAYAAGSGGVFARKLTNKWIDIFDNVIDGSPQGCIGVHNSSSVRVLSNSCNDTNRSQMGEGSISVSRSDDVVVSRNRRSGSSKGIVVDGQTSRRVDVQLDY